MNDRTAQASVEIHTLTHAQSPLLSRYPPEWVFDPSASSPQIELDKVPISETWKGMEAVHAQGLAKHIGVCNFGVSLLTDLLSYCTVPPAVLQVPALQGGVCVGLDQ